MVLVQDNEKHRPTAIAVITDSDGHFEIKKISPNRYNFFASHSGFVNQRYQPKGSGEGAVLALTPGQELENVVFRMVRAAVVTGRIVDDTGEPIAHVMVSALRRPTADELEEDATRGRKQVLQTESLAQTDDRGDYRIFGLKPGEYYVKASESSDFAMGGAVDSLDRMASLSLGSQFAPLYFPGVLQSSEAQSIPLRAGEEMTADFIMRQVKTFEVSGRVIAADGKPATHAYISMGVPDVEEWSFDLGSSTDGKGEFTIKSVPPGSYILTAQQHDEGRHEMVRQKVGIGEENLDSVVIAFGHGTTLNGRVSAMGSGVALDRMHVSLSSQDESEAAAESWAQVRPDGSFELTDIADGSYSLVVYGMEKTWFVESAHLGGVDVLQKGVQLERGTGNGSLAVILSSAAAQLEGVVSDHDKPVAAAQVRARPDPETPYNLMRAQRTSTDQNGHFTFATVAPGKYKIVAKLRGSSEEEPVVSSDPKTVTLGEHDHQSLQLTLEVPKSE